MSKQDRQGARTPANLEQKYSFGRVFSQQERENARQNEEMNQQNLTMKQFISFASLAIENLQKDLTAANKTIQELSDKDKALEESNSSLSSQITNYWKTIYPVGHIYISLSSTSPATLFGGTWERMKDTFLLAAGDTYSAGSTGGEATHKLTESELPNITGSYALRPWGSSNSAMQVSVTGAFTRTADGSAQGGVASSGVQGTTYKTTLSFGNDQPHNNMPPYTTVYVWKRTA